MTSARTKAELIQYKSSIEKYLKENNNNHNEELLDILKILAPLSIKKELIIELKIGPSIKKVKDKYTEILSNSPNSCPQAKEIINISNELMLMWKKVIQGINIITIIIILVIIVLIRI